MKYQLVIVDDEYKYRCGVICHLRSREQSTSQVV